MKLARYVGAGQIEVRDEDRPGLTPGGILIKTEASGLCSGELMDWYMERKVPHVLGHEISGTVIESDSELFPIGTRVAPHHHAPCMTCEFCLKKKFVHCQQWKSTRLIPGGMAEYVSVPKENFNDVHIVNNLRARDAALAEPLGCVMKSLQVSQIQPKESCCVIGLGVMGLLHMLALQNEPVGLEVSEIRREWATSLGLTAIESTHENFDVVFVCPGNESAFNLGLDLLKPGGRIVMFSPFAPESAPAIDWERVYFQECSVLPSYSCGPDDVSQALDLLKSGKVKAEQVVSDFIHIDQLPQAYQDMKAGKILKAMVEFP